MYLYFEEDGAFKAGTVVSETGNAYQVTVTTGRRTKIKAAKVFFTFESPAPVELLEAAETTSAELDPGFLWEVAPEGDFSFEDIAKEYWGATPTPVERAAVLLALHGNPVYFHRKGRGMYRRAPEEILKQALEALERKKRREEQRRAWVAEMDEGHLPEALARDVMGLLMSPDKNGIEWKALSDAAANARMSPLRLMLKLGGVKSPWTWHVESFYRENFPRGRGFPADLPLPAPLNLEDLPKAKVRAFSIDDSSTTEIDDALSVTHGENGKTVVGVHIAVPALGIVRDDALDKVARARMSTVYAPGLKTTMLPEPWIEGYSLDEGRSVPCLSLYITVHDDTFGVEKTETRLERITVERNVRHDRIDELVTEEAIENHTLDIEYAEEISWLWHFARRLLREREEVRGRPELTNRVDWFFVLEGEGEDASIHVRGRRRGAPLDLLVAELMIYANQTWGLWLEEHAAAGIYRSQRMGRVRMSTTPGPHDGLGVVRYAWCTSPLRRYVDLVNQRQILQVLRGESPAYASNDADLFTIVSQFETIYGTYADFQTKMERYWSLRWILQEGLREIEAIVVKGDLVRIDRLPFMQRVPGLPEDLPKGRKVLLQILGCDLVDLVMDSKLLRILDEEDESAVEEDEEEDAMPDENAPAEEKASDAPENA